MKDLFPLVSLGNDAPLAVDSANLVPGTIALANEARFTATNMSEPLTQYAVGWRDTENIQNTIDWVAPRVPVGRRFEFKKADNSEAFLSEVDDERAIGAAFKRVEYKGSTQLGKTRNRGLTIRIDRDEDGAVVNEERVVALLRQRMLRNELRRVLTLLLAAGTNTNKTWNNAATPDDDMIAAIAASQLDAGVFPNRALIGLAGWNLRRSSYAAQNNAGAIAGLAKSATEVAGMMGLDDMRISRELFQVSATTKQRIMTSTFACFQAQALLGKDDPSNFKRFVTPVGDGDFRVYRQEVGPKFIDITIEGYSDTVGTSTVGVQRITIS